MGIASSREKKEIKGFLLQAIINGDICAVKEIMSHHPQFLKSKFELNGNAFHMAVISRHDAVLAYLLSGDYLQ
jgi:ankyrin repeat protein